MLTLFRLRWILPALGLIIFCIISYSSFQWHRQYAKNRRIFMWSSVHLDADPLNRDPSKFRNTNCAPKDADCAEWDPATLWIEPGFLTRTLMLSAFPAFMVGGLMVYLFARLGVNEVVSFMVFMPILIFVWFYVVGKVITKWGLRLGGRIRFAADGR